MKQNLNCSGSTRVDGGEYGEVRVSASLRVDGDLRCDTLQCSGSAKIEGALSCAGEVRCSGSVKVAGEAAMQEGRFSGSVKAQSLHCTGTLQCSGSAKTEGGMQLGKARFSGSCAAEGDIHAEELEIAGSLRAPAVEAERFHASGVFRIDGLLNAGVLCLLRTIFLETTYASCSGSTPASISNFVFLRIFGAFKASPSLSPTLPMKR